MFTQICIQKKSRIQFYEMKIALTHKIKINNIKMHEWIVTCSLFAFVNNKPSINLPIKKKWEGRRIRLILRLVPFEEGVVLTIETLLCWQWIDFWMVFLEFVWFLSFSLIFYSHFLFFFLLFFLPSFSSPSPTS